MIVQIVSEVGQAEGRGVVEVVIAVFLYAVLIANSLFID